MVEKEKVEQLLTENGLDVAGAENYTNFADEDSLVGVLNAMKKPTFESLEDLDKDPKLKALASQYSDKQLAALQSKYDLSQKQIEELKGGKKSDIDSEKGDDEIPAWAKSVIDTNKTLQEKLQAIEEEKKQNKEINDFNAKVKKTAEKYSLKDEYQVKLLRGQLKKDSSDEDIDKAFKAHVDYLNKNKISLGGNLTIGDKHNKSKVDSAIAEIIKEEERKKKRDSKK